MKGRKEQRILVEILRAANGLTSIDTLRRLTRKCDFVRLEELTARTGLEGLIYSVCNRKDLAGLFPEEYTGFLLRKAGLAAIRNSFIRENAMEVIAALEKEGIRCIILKGIEVLERLYGDDMLRDVLDLDILVEPGQFTRAAGILYGLGYINPEYAGLKREYDLESGREEDLPVELAFVREAIPYPYIVDLHSELVGFKKGSLLREIYPVAGFDWHGNAVKLSLEGREVPVLAPEMEFLFMVFHFSMHHSFMSMKWLSDLCRMLMRYQEEIDWEWIRGSVRNPNLTKLVAICLHMAGEHTGITSFGGHTARSFHGKRLHPGFYKRMLFVPLQSTKAKVCDKLVKVMLPASVKDRLRVLGYYLFQRNAMSHRIDGKQGQKTDLLQPFKLLVYSLRHKRGKG